MPISINYNRSSADGLRYLHRSYGELLKTMEKLSSGLKINRASDDPAGLVISEQLRSRIASLNQEIENTSLAIRKYETADATVSQMRAVLTDIRSQAVGAANAGFNDEVIHAAYQAAADEAVNSYNRIIETATFNNANLLDGSDGSLTHLPPLADVDLSSAEKAEQSLKTIDQAFAELDRVQSEIGATQKYELEARRSNLEVTAQNLTAAESEIRDTDYALESAALIRNQIRVQAGAALLAHHFVTQQSVLTLLNR